MGRKRSRGDLPFPVAPIPSIPAISAQLAVHDVEDRLERWYGELDDWLHIWRSRDSTFYRHLPRITEQIRLMLRYADTYLPEGVLVPHLSEKRTTLARFHELLGRALSAATDPELHEEADSEFKQATTLAPEVADLWYSYVRHLILGRRIREALNEINAVELRLIQTEEESIAQQIVNWSLAYPEIGCGIRADIIKLCVALVSRVGTGLIVHCCPLPKAPGTQWQRTEILRVLWAGMQCSVPVDELLNRAGIDEATYYRWRKRYLPPQWGKDPALV